jgi:hypothetical protein
MTRLRWRQQTALSTDPLFAKKSRDKAVSTAYPDQASATRSACKKASCFRRQPPERRNGAFGVRNGHAFDRHHYIVLGVRNQRSGTAGLGTVAGLIKGPQVPKEWGKDDAELSGEEILLVRRRKLTL